MYNDRSTKLRINKTSNFHINSFLKEHVHLFIIGNIYLFFGLYLMNDFDPNKATSGFFNIILLMVIITSIMFYLIVFIIFMESIENRKDEYILLRYKQIPLTIYYGDFERIVFIIPTIAIALIYLQYTLLIISKIYGDIYRVAPFLILSIICILFLLISHHNQKILEEFYQKIKQAEEFGEKFGEKLYLLNNDKKCMDSLKISQYKEMSTELQNKYQDAKEFAENNNLENSGLIDSIDSILELISDFDDEIEILILQSKHENKSFQK